MPRPFCCSSLKPYFSPVAEVLPLHVLLDALPKSAPAGPAVVDIGNGGSSSSPTFACQSQLQQRQQQIPFETLVAMSLVSATPQVQCSRSSLGARKSEAALPAVAVVLPNVAGGKQALRLSRTSMPQFTTSFCSGFVCGGSLLK